MIKYDVDVLVIGGGCAGVAAGVTAARRGLRTLLIENMYSLGGLMTNGYVTGVAGIIEGLCKELLDRLDAQGFLVATPHSPSVEPERCKYEMETMLLQAGCRILYGCRAIGVNMDGSMIRDVIVATKSGVIEIAARMFIDATGDGDVAAFAGAPYEVGNAEYMGLNLAHTMGIRMANVNLVKFREANKAWVEDNTGYPDNMCLAGACMDQAVKNGDLPYPIFPGGLINQIPGAPDEAADVSFCVGHSYYNHNLDTEDLTRQVVEQHQQSVWIEAAYRKYVPGFENCRIVAIGSLPGIRDSRRIIGEYILKDSDIAAAVKFEDAIAKFPEIYDTHHPTSGYHGFRHHIHSKTPIPTPSISRSPATRRCTPSAARKGQLGRLDKPTQYCEIPYRCIVPLKVDNLLVAGRCVSTEFHAMAAVRIIAICMATGEAAAIAADLSLKDGITPRRMDGRRVRQALIDSGVPLDKAPDGYWAYLRETSSLDTTEHEFVRLRGDMMGVRLKNGKITMRFNLTAEDMK
jgi:ribulose 1,5-bisphosphate synthetase/thiazole synthase